MIKLLIFDLDGTLIDSAPDVVQTTHDLLRARGKPLLSEERIVAAIGEGLKQTVFSLFPETHSDPVTFAALEQEFFAHYERNLLKRTKIFPGVEQFLARCQLKTAIVTNKQEYLTHKTLAGLGLDRLPWVRVFGADSLPRRKPDPLPLLEVMKAANVTREETLMIGDGIPDMIAARRAGVHAIAIEFGYASLEVLQAQGASLTVAHFDQLESVIEQASKLPPRAVEAE